MPFFSVIVPLYNKEQYVVRALNSILNQTFTDFEILVINDCCTDKSVELVKQLNCSKIKIINHTENKGLSATRNTGIKNSKSNYITYLDADDEWKPTFLSSILYLIQNFKEASIFGTNYEEIWGETIKIPSNGSETLNPNFKGYLNFFKINIKQGIY